MRAPDNKIDADLHSYAKRWMKSLSRPRASTTLGYFFVGLFILFWSSTLTTQIGFDIKKWYGSLVFIGIILLLSLAVVITNNIMAKIGLERAIRSALWLSAVIGPYVNQAVKNTWNSPVISHIAGFFAAIFAFIVSFLLDKLLDKLRRQSLTS